MASRHLARARRLVGETEKTDYIVDMETWAADGTFARLDEAIDRRDPVQIRRSSGEFVTGILVALGMGGLLATVAWGDDLDRIERCADRVRFPPGVQGKHVPTRDLLTWNPSLRGEDGEP